MPRRHELLSKAKYGFALVFFLCIQMVHAQTVQRIAKIAFTSTVLLAMWDANRQPVALGSGFGVGDGLIATNYHVIEGASGGTAKFVGVSTTYRIEGIVASDPARDLVILRVSFSGPKPLRMGDSDAVQIGDTVYAVGNPLGLEGTFSQGIISGIRSVESDSLIQITAAISPGSSGGPVLDSSGAVIGVAVATFKSGQNLNFAVPVNYLKSLIQSAGAPKALNSSTPVSKGIVSALGDGRIDGVTAGTFLWNNWSQTDYTFSILNQLSEPITNVRVLIILGADNVPLDSSVIVCDEIIPPGAAKRIKGYTDDSVGSLMREPTEDRKHLRGMVEFRVLDFNVVQ